MKAPEKIYLQENTTTDCYEEFYPEWFEARARKSDVEYIRTDAFIDKACEFLKTYRQETPDGMGYIAGIVNDETIEDFRKYMEK